jgi:putative ATP-dependent endonuclease of OLD family
MAIIRHLKIENFRSVRETEWCPRAGLNCLIGPGDSGKSTLLDAIDFALGARRSVSFTDADFYQMDTSNPITINVTLGELDDELKSLDGYGYFLRGFDHDSCVPTHEQALRAIEQKLSDPHRTTRLLPL